jgi:hypothetical protein
MTDMPSGGTVYSNCAGDVNELKLGRAGQFVNNPTPKDVRGFGLEVSPANVTRNCVPGVAENL